MAPSFGFTALKPCAQASAAAIQRGDSFADMHRAAFRAAKTAGFALRLTGLARDGTGFGEIRAFLLRRIQGVCARTNRGMPQ